MSTRGSLADKVRALKKGDSVKVKANRNVASVTAHRVLGQGNYSVEGNGSEYSTITRTK